MKNKEKGSINKGVGVDMEVLLRVICTTDGSLREKIVSDKKIKDFNLIVSKQKTAGRNPGWAKIHSTEKRGVLNIHWESSTRILVCRAVTKYPNKPDSIIGDFIAYLFARNRNRIKAIIF